MDLFVSYMSAQLERFFRWRLNPEAEVVSIFAHDWTHVQGRGYANPRWVVIRHRYSVDKILDARTKCPNVLKWSDTCKLWSAIK